MVKMSDSLELILIDGNLLSVKGQLSHINANESIKKLRLIIQSHHSGALQINLSELESVNSVVLSFLLSGIRAASKSACLIRYAGMSDSLFNMARVGGVEGLLTTSD